MTKIPKPVDRHVGNLVRERRMAVGMSQTDLADQLGITFQQVQKYEKGTNRISSSRLQHIANILKVPVTFFFDDAPGQFKATGKAPSSDYVKEFCADADGLALIQAFTRLPTAALRRRVVNLVREIADGRK